MKNKQDEVKVTIQTLGQLLEEIHEVLSKQRGGYQNRSDIRSGSFRRSSGILVPFRMHRFVYENYDLFILRAYFQLFQYTLKAESEIFILTTLRILQELGIKKIDILFAGVLTPDEHAKARLISVLSDWILLGHGEYSKYFQELLEEERTLLDETGQKIFGEVSAHLSSSSSPIPTSLSKPMNRYRDGILGEYAKKSPALNFIKEPNLESLISYWSELLHGNPLMLEQIFNEQLRWRAKNRLYAVLWFTGQHALRRVQARVQEKELTEKITDMIGQADNIWQQLVEDWKLEAQKRRQ